jgi:hypothetical protein
VELSTAELYKTQESEKTRYTQNMAEAPQVASALSLNKKGSDIVIGSVV